MKRIVLSTLFVLSLSNLVTPTAKAQSNRVSQFNLVQLAKQGFLKEHDIPSHQALCSAVASKRVKAKDVVQAAIAENRLVSEKIEDKDYLRSVENKIQRMCIRH